MNFPTHAKLHGAFFWHCIRDVAVDSATDRYVIESVACGTKLEDGWLTLAFRAPDENEICPSCLRAFTTTV